MAAPSLTYTLTNGTTADASQVMQNFNDLLNGITDGTKDLSINALTCAGTATLNGHINLGNSSSDDLTITASLAATLPIKTNTSFDVGSSTKGLQALYLGGTSTFTGKIASATLSASRVWTVPETAADASFLMTKSAQSKDGILTFNDGIKVDDAAGQSTLNSYISSTSNALNGSSTTFSNAASGANCVTTATAATISAILVKVGDMVVCRLPGTALMTKSSTNGYLELAGIIPSGWRVQAITHLSGEAKVNNVATTVLFRFETNGDIRMYNANGTNIAANTTNCGWDASVSFAWPVT